LVVVFFSSGASHGVAQARGNRLNERCLHRQAILQLRYRKQPLLSDTRCREAFGKVAYGLQYIAKVFYRSIYR